MAQTFDALLKAPGILVLPGAFDALSVRIAVRSGAKAVYMTGFGVAGASFGVPDIGLVNAEQTHPRREVRCQRSMPWMFGLMEFEVLSVLNLIGNQHFLNVLSQEVDCRRFGTNRQIRIGNSPVLQSQHQLGERWIGFPQPVSFV